MFAMEQRERDADCILDKAMRKAENAKIKGSISAPEFYRIQEKVTALKKLKFVEEYEGHQDKQTYEWIKYKVAAEIGGEEEREAF